MRYMIFLSACAFLMICAAVRAAPLEEPLTVTVLELGVYEGALTANIKSAGMQAGKAASRYVSANLARRQKFRLVSRDWYRKQADLATLTTVGNIDRVTAGRLGEVLGVHYLIYGDVSDMSVSGTGVQVNGAALGTVSGGVTVGTVKAHIILFMVDTMSGMVVGASEGEGVSKCSYTKAGSKHLGYITLGTKTVTMDSLENAVEKAAETAVGEMMAMMEG